MEQLDENALTIYTDGSSYSSPRVGGAGFLFITVDHEGKIQTREESPPGWKGATNNQMELQACIDALRIVTGRRSPFDLSEFSKIVIRTDSMYVSENFDSAKFTWPKTGWKTRDGPPVANTPQWKELVKLVKKAGLRVEVNWVRGHKRDPHNRRADGLAKRSAKTPSMRTFGHRRVRRKMSSYEVEKGSVRMQGSDDRADRY